MRLRRCQYKKSDMVLPTPEQMNAVRQSIHDGDWSRGVKIAMSPMRSSLYRVARGMLRVRKQRHSDATLNEPAGAPSLSRQIYPLFVANVKNLQAAAGIERLFADVDKQIQGTYLLGGGYRRVALEALRRLSEVEDRHGIERLYWMARYARSVAFGHPTAFIALRSSWTKWLQIAHEPIAFEAYTVAERIASLSESLFWLAQYAAAPSADYVVSMKQQIWRDAYRLSRNIEYGLGSHNHLLNDARGLFRASLVMPELNEALAWRDQAFSLWDEFFPKLVLEDGSFAEQSSHYQLMLCRTALEYFLAARHWRRALPEGFDARLSRMFEVANDLLRRDGSLPRFGDNSPDHPIEDLWGLMAAAHHYGLLASRPRHDAVTPLTLFYCGDVPSLKPGVAQSKNSFYPQGGFMFLRSRDESLELTVHADPRAEVSAHGDSGRGSFELWWDGQVIVREPGSFLSASNPRSAWSRSGLAQNVTCLNGLAPGVTAEDRRVLPASYAKHGGSWVAYGGRKIQFRWNGFCRIREGITLWRTWRLTAAGDLSLEEHIEGSGKVGFESRLCLGEGRWKMVPRSSGRDAGLTWTGSDGSSLVAQFQLPPNVNPTMAVGSYLPEFGVEKQALVFVLGGTVNLPIKWTAVWQRCGSSSEVAQG